MIRTLTDEDFKRQVVGTRLIERSLVTIERALFDDIVDGILEILHREGE